MIILPLIFMVACMHSHPHPHQTCQHIVEHALRNQGPAQLHLVANAALNKTQLAKVLSAPIINGVLTRVPDVGTINVSQGNYSALEVIVNLTTATKEALGNTLTLSVYKADGTFVDGNIWVSYGKQITVTDPNGTVVIDPDPGVHINIAALNGQDVYLTYLANGITSAGATVNGLK